MLEYFTTQIKPAALRLEFLLDQIDPLECNHEAEEVEVDDLEFDADSGRFAPTGTAKETRCTKCNSWYNEIDETWETVS